MVLKKPGTDLYLFLDEACDYCHSLLEVSPGRLSAYCCLTNYHQAWFVAAGIEADNRERMYYAKVEHGDEDTAREIADFIACPIHVLGYVDALAGVINAANHFSLDRPLGRGSTSTAVQMRRPHMRNRCVLKISRDTAALDNEVTVLAGIREYCLNNITHQGKCKTALALFPVATAYPSHPYFITLDRVLSTHLPNIIDKSHLLQIWDTLQHAHRAGYVHRDIRWPNIALSKDGRSLCLLDWSSANNFQGSLKSPPGGRKTASIPVLEKMLFAARIICVSPSGFVTSKAGNYACSANDEAVSVIYLAIQKLPIEPNMLTYPSTVDDATRLRNTDLDYIAEISGMREDVIRRSIHRLLTNTVPPGRTATDEVSDALDVIFGVEGTLSAMQAQFDEHDARCKKRRSVVYK